MLAKARAFNLKLDKGSPEVAAVLAEIKRLEKEGYEFEAAEAREEGFVLRVLEEDFADFAGGLVGGVEFVEVAEGEVAGCQVLLEFGDGVVAVFHGVV